MSLMKQVEALIAERGASCADDLMPYLDAPRDKVVKAVLNLSSRGKLVMVKRGTKLMRDRQEPSIYDIPGKAPPVPAQSAKSLMKRVAALVDEAGEGSRDTLLAQCPGYTAEQIKRALNNAAQNGLIYQARRVTAYGLAVYKPAHPTVYRRPVASVWELGSRAIAG